MYRSQLVDAKSCRKSEGKNVMAVVFRNDEIRDLVTWSFRRYGASANSLLALEEDILVEDGKHIARSYRVDPLMAMWLVEVGIVQFYDADGRMLQTVNLLEHRETQRNVA
jgi:hypothetical protein